jgi:hypothetical protein
MIKKKPAKMAVSKRDRGNKGDSVTAGIFTKEYVETLSFIKNCVQEAQIKASFAANAELIMLYWAIGKIIVEKQGVGGWGTGVIE